MPSTSPTPIAHTSLMEHSLLPETSRQPQAAECTRGEARVGCPRIQSQVRATATPPYKNAVDCYSVHPTASTPSVDSNTGIVDMTNSGESPLNSSDIAHQTESFGQVILERTPATSPIRTDFAVLANIAAWKVERFTLREAPMALFQAGVPVAEMKTLMKTYGAETINAKTLYSGCSSDGALRRKFRRWNPSFFHYFELSVETKVWVPKLGEPLEHLRRQIRRNDTKEDCMRKRLECRKETSQQRKAAKRQTCHNLRNDVR
jgi:hypothetical protein